MNKKIQTTKILFLALVMLPMQLAFAASINDYYHCYEHFAVSIKIGSFHHRIDDKAQRIYILGKNKLYERVIPNKFYTNHGLLNPPAPEPGSATQPTQYYFDLSLPAEDVGELKYVSLVFSKTPEERLREFLGGFLAGPTELRIGGLSSDTSLQWSKAAGYSNKIVTLKKPNNRGDQTTQEKMLSHLFKQLNTNPAFRSIGNKNPHCAKLITDEDFQKNNEH